MGFEPMHRGFADPCLTTWLRRRLIASLAQPACSGTGIQISNIKRQKINPDALTITLGFVEGEGDPNAIRYRRVRLHGA
jgi:hypothetical protein